ncbi:MAG: glycosyltransferase family 2 protein [Prolixibacteraceae bacterium]
MTNSQAPKVSVVLPFYNAKQTLEKAVRSILNQTFHDFELILVNNNSTDESNRISLLMASEDGRIQVLQEPRQGVTFAANTGNVAAKGQYIARMDADDFSHPARLEKQVELLDANPEIGVTSCLVQHIGHQANTNGLYKFVEWTNSIQQADEIALNCFIEAPIINPTVLFRRELLDLHGGYIHGDFPEDYEMWLRWINNGVKIQKVPEVLFDWHDSDSRLTRTDERYSTEAFYRTKTEHLAKWLLENNHPYIWVWGAGRITRQRAKLLQEKGIWIEGYIDVKERKLLDACCIAYENFNWDAPAFFLSYVANWGARDEIRNYLIAKGKIEGEDFILIA